MVFSSLNSGAGWSPHCAVMTFSPPSMPLETRLQLSRSDPSEVVSRIAGPDGLPASMIFSMNSIVAFLIASSWASSAISTALRIA